MTAFKIILALFSTVIAFASGRPSLQPLAVGKDNHHSENKVTSVQNEKISGLITTFLHAPNPLMEYMNQQRTPNNNNNRRQIIYQQTILLPSRYLASSSTSTTGGTGMISLNKQPSDMTSASPYASLRPSPGVRTSTNNNRQVAYQIGGNDQSAWPFQMTINDPNISMLNSFTNVIEYGPEDTKEIPNIKSSSEQTEPINDGLVISETKNKEIETTKDSDLIKIRRKRSQVSVDKVNVYTLEEVLQNILNKRSGKSLNNAAVGRLLPDGEYHMTSQLEGKPSITLESFANLFKDNEQIPEHGRRTVPLESIEKAKLKSKDKESEDNENEEINTTTPASTTTTTTTTPSNNTPKKIQNNKKKTSEKDKKENELFLNLYNPLQYHILPSLPQGIYPLQYVTTAVQPQLTPQIKPTYSLINWFRSLPVANTKTENTESSHVLPSTINTESDILSKDTVVIRQGGIAIAGPGGEASTGAGGTAIVGPGGVAYAEPNTLSVVGPGGRVVDPNSLARGVEHVLAWGPVVYRHPPN